MFDEGDHEFMMNSDSMIPDGVIDGTNYAKKFVDIAKVFGEMHSDFAGHIRWIMECVNACHDPDKTGDDSFAKDHALDTVTVLSYLTMTMKTLLEQNDLFDSYMNYLNSDVIPQMLDECAAIPWYDFSKEIKDLIEDESGFYLDEEDD